MDLTRRGFLQSAGAATALLALQRLVPTTFAFGADGAGVAEAVASYRGWEDLYRGKWTWDKVVRSSHFVNCWYQAHCAWNVYVKDGVVWREEQVADYPAIRADVPDYNPRGCQKG